MNELDVLINLPSLDYQDNEDYDVFATQFTNSLINHAPNEDPPPYWHGRLIGAVEEKDRSISGYRIDFLGKNYDEIEFRRKLKTNEILILSFEILTDPVYEADEAADNNAREPHIVSYTARIVARVDGEELSKEVTVNHRIRKTFLAYKTTIE